MTGKAAWSGQTADIRCIIPRCERYGKHIRIGFCDSFFRRILIFWTLIFDWHSQQNV